MKKILNKLSTYLMIFVMLFANPVTMIVANAADGDDVTPVDSVTMGDLDAAGHIQVTKSVAPTENAGEYTVTFNVQSVARKISKPLYAVVVFDRSGSMICDPSFGESNYAWFDTNILGLKYETADNELLKCGDITINSAAFTTDKWENAIAGAQTFRDSIVNELGDKAHVSLITFGSDGNGSKLGAVSPATEDFSDASFGHPLGGTRLDLGINSAVEKLNSDTSGNSSAKKVILVISDGSPDDAGAATAAANAAKNDNNIEIYAIGYETNSTTSNYLKSIATDADHYSDANASSVSAAVQAMADELVALNGAEIVETPNSPAFSLNSGENANKQLEVLSVDDGTGIVTYKPITYTITINPATPTGVIEVNDKSNTKIVAGDEVLFNIDQSPSVSWTRPKYGYTVNYYYDSITDDNYLGSTVCQSSEQCAVDLSETKTLDDDEVLAKLMDIDSKTSAGYHLGYVLQDGQSRDITITDTESNNVLNVLYVKGQFNYNVKYHYEKATGGWDDVDDSNTYTATFDEPIPADDITAHQRAGLVGHDSFMLEDSYTVQNPAKIGLDQNVLDIYYQRHGYDYCINYFYDGEQDQDATENGTAPFESTISYLDHLKPRTGYMLFYADPETMTISDDARSNVMNIFYETMRIYYTVEYYYDGILDESKTDDILALYGDTITGYEDKVMDGYELDGVEGLPLVISDEDENIIKVYYKSVPTDEPIPNTSVDGVSRNVNYYELLLMMIGFYLSALYIEKRED